tara:strand:- start:50 stop:229 length:180 start_codon:yes stop_codon:yes gene_type:complete
MENKTIALETYSEKPFRSYFQITNPLTPIKPFEDVVDPKRSATAYSYKSNCKLAMSKLL